MCARVRVCEIIFYYLYACYATEDLQEKVNRLESENVKMREEFNVQRAKLKELFLQKEGKHGQLKMLGRSNLAAYNGYSQKS